MCGLAGFVSNIEKKGPIIKRITDTMIHRGPDGEGYYIDENIALGHRRLAIIDLENGKQPMISKNQDIIVIFNGEIYNYKELKKILEKAGHVFRTNSDTEILIHGYEEWKKDLPKKLRGMFAFAIWNRNTKTLFCARDYFGIKPFYYYKDENIFMFASEIKALLEYPNFKKILNKNLLGTYLSFSFTPTQETFFKGVFTLQPGASLEFKDGKLTLENYYEISFDEKNKDYDETINDISSIMKDSIEHHMISDVEVGAFLSSGIDSSYIVSLAKPNNTYTAGYESFKYSEIEFSKNLSNRLGINNISKKITKEEYLNSVKKILYYMDEPLSDPSAISLYFVSKIASEDVKVILSGEGADEFFGGYNTYQEEEQFKWYNKIPFIIRHVLGVLFEQLPEFKGRNFIVRRGRKLEENYIGVNKIFSEKERKKVLSFKDNIKNSDITKDEFYTYKNKNNIVKMQAIDIKYWLARNILLKADKMTMANSIEARTPFIDKKVFEVASSLTLQYKVSKTNTKIALREASKKVIPSNAYKKKKLGFPVPLREWMREDVFYKEIKNTFCQDFVKEFFNQKYILKLLEEHRKNKKDNYRKVWSIYCFIKWYEVFFFNKIPQINPRDYNSSKFDKKSGLLLDKNIKVV